MPLSGGRTIIRNDGLDEHRETLSTSADNAGRHMPQLLEYSGIYFLVTDDM